MPLTERARRAALGGSATWQSFLDTLTEKERGALTPGLIRTLASIACYTDDAPRDDMQQYGTPGEEH